MEAPRICAAINQVWIYDRAGCGRDESTGCTDSDNNGCPDDNNDCQRKFARQGEQVSMLPNSLSVPEYPKDWVRVRIDRDGTAIIGWIRISQLKCP
jgi:hypothetical protein